MSTGVGVLRPHSWRQEFLQVIHDEMQLAVAAGQPLGGVILSGLLHPDQPDVTGYGIHDSVTGVTRQRPPLADVTQRVRMKGYQGLDICVVPTILACWLASNGHQSCSVQPCVLTTSLMKC